ncbi:hypothetical protein AURDEDRAFT_126139 [Auricularia subglabra TFB-10046 SS5]|nr:hypothetical protein AURDEDRAFT_126139 [Auricularia subglabra TFB-10046 SS5]
MSSSVASGSGRGRDLEPFALPNSHCHEPDCHCAALWVLALKDSAGNTVTHHTFPPWCPPTGRCHVVGCVCTHFVYVRQALTMWSGRPNFPQASHQPGNLLPKYLCACQHSQEATAAVAGSITSPLTPAFAHRPLDGPGPSTFRTFGDTMQEPQGSANTRRVNSYINHRPQGSGGASGSGGVVSRRPGPRIPPAGPARVLRGGKRAASAPALPYPPLSAVSEARRTPGRPPAPKKLEGVIIWFPFDISDERVDWSPSGGYPSIDDLNIYTSTFGVAHDHLHALFERQIESGFGVRFKLTEAEAQTGYVFDALIRHSQEAFDERKMHLFSTFPGKLSTKSPHVRVLATRKNGGRTVFRPIIRTPSDLGVDHLRSHPTDASRTSFYIPMCPSGRHAYFTGPIRHLPMAHGDSAHIVPDGQHHCLCVKSWDFSQDLMADAAPVIAGRCLSICPHMPSIGAILGPGSLTRPLVISTPLMPSVSALDHMQGVLSSQTPAFNFMGMQHDAANKVLSTSTPSSSSSPSASFDGFVTSPPYPFQLATNPQPRTPLRPFLSPTSSMPSLPPAAPATPQPSPPPTWPTVASLAPFTAPPPSPILRPAAPPLPDRLPAAEASLVARPPAVVAPSPVGPVLPNVDGAPLGAAALLAQLGQQLSTQPLLIDEPPQPAPAETAASPSSNERSSSPASSMDDSDSEVALGDGAHGADDSVNSMSPTDLPPTDYSHWLPYMDRFFERIEEVAPTIDTRVVLSYDPAPDLHYPDQSGDPPVLSKLLADIVRLMVQRDPPRSAQRVEQKIREMYPNVQLVVQGFTPRNLLASQDLVFSMGKAVGDGVHFTAIALAMAEVTSTPDWKAVGSYKVPSFQPYGNLTTEQTFNLRAAGFICAWSSLRARRIPVVHPLLVFAYVASTFLALPMTDHTVLGLLVDLPLIEAVDPVSFGILSLWPVTYRDPVPSPLNCASNATLEALHQALQDVNIPWASKRTEESHRLMTLGLFSYVLLGINLVVHGVPASFDIFFRYFDFDVAQSDYPLLAAPLSMLFANPPAHRGWEPNEIQAIKHVITGLASKLVTKEEIDARLCYAGWEGVLAWDDVPLLKVFQSQFDRYLSRLGHPDSLLNVLDVVNADDPLWQKTLRPTLFAKSVSTHDGLPPAPPGASSDPSLAITMYYTQVEDPPAHVDDPAPQAFHFHVCTRDVDVKVNGPFREMLRRSAACGRTFGLFFSLIALGIHSISLFAVFIVSLSSSFYLRGIYLREYDLLVDDIRLFVRTRLDNAANQDTHRQRQRVMHYLTLVESRQDLFSAVELLRMRQSCSQMVDAIDDYARRQRDPPLAEPSAVTIVPTGGRPRKVIDPEFLRNTSEFRGPSGLARVLGVCARTVRRQQLELGIGTPQPPVFLYPEGGPPVRNPASLGSRAVVPAQPLAPAELDAIVAELMNRFHNHGRSLLHGHLHSMGHNPTRAMISESMLRITGVPGTFGRPRIRPNPYRVAGPGSLWHHDGQHDIANYGGASDDEDEDDAEANRSVRRIQYRVEPEHGDIADELRHPNGWARPREMFEVRVPEPAGRILEADLHALDEHLAASVDLTSHSMAARRLCHGVFSVDARDQTPPAILCSATLFARAPRTLPTSRFRPIAQYGRPDPDGARDGVDTPPQDIVMRTLLLVFVAAGNLPTPFVTPPVLAVASVRVRDPDGLPTLKTILAQVSQLAPHVSPAGDLLQHVLSNTPSTHVWTGSAMLPSGYLTPVGDQAPPLGRVSYHGSLAAILDGRMPPSSARLCSEPAGFIAQLRQGVAPGLGVAEARTIPVHYIFLQHFMLRDPTRPRYTLRDPPGLPNLPMPPSESPPESPEASSDLRLPLTEGQAQSTPATASSGPHAHTADSLKQDIRSSFPDAAADIAICIPATRAPNQRGRRSINPFASNYGSAYAGWRINQRLQDIFEALSLDPHEPSRTRVIQFASQTCRVSCWDVLNTFGIPHSTWNASKARFAGLDAVVRRLETSATTDAQRTLLHRLRFFCHDVSKVNPMENPLEFANEHAIWDWGTEAFRRERTMWRQFNVRDRPCSVGLAMNDTPVRLYQLNHLQHNGFLATHGQAYDNLREQVLGLSYRYVCKVRNVCAESDRRAIDEALPPLSEHVLWDSQTESVNLYQGQRRDGLTRVYLSNTHIQIMFTRALSSITVIADGPLHSELPVVNPTVHECRVGGLHDLDLVDPPSIRSCKTWNDLAIVEKVDRQVDPTHFKWTKRTLKLFSDAQELWAFAGHVFNTGTGTWVAIDVEVTQAGELTEVGLAAARFRTNGRDRSTALGDVVHVIVQEHMHLRRPLAVRRKTLPFWLDVPYAHHHLRLAAQGRTLCPGQSIYGETTLRPGQDGELLKQRDSNAVLTAGTLPEFLFGASDIMSMPTFVDFMRTFLAEASRDGPLFIVCHDDGLEKRVLRDRMGVLPFETTGPLRGADGWNVANNTVRYVDTQALYFGMADVDAGSRFQASLIKMALSLQVAASNEGWHNAGNDAKARTLFRISGIARIFTLDQERRSSIRRHMDKVPVELLLEIVAEALRKKKGAPAFFPLRLAGVDHRLRTEIFEHPHLWRKKAVQRNINVRGGFLWDALTANEHWQGVLHHGQGAPVATAVAPVATAAQGAQGVPGVQGVQAVQAVQGVQGVQAVQGVQGVQAVQAVQGVQLEGDWTGTLIACVLACLPKDGALSEADVTWASNMLNTLRRHCAAFNQPCLPHNTVGPYYRPVAGYQLPYGSYRRDILALQFAKRARITLVDALAATDKNPMLIRGSQRLLRFSAHLVPQGCSSDTAGAVMTEGYQGWIASTPPYANQWGWLIHFDVSQSEALLNLQKALDDACDAIRAGESVEDQEEALQVLVENLLHPMQGPSYTTVVTRISAAFTARLALTNNALDMVQTASQQLLASLMTVIRVVSIASGDTIQNLGLDVLVNQVLAQIEVGGSPSLGFAFHIYHRLHHPMRLMSCALVLSPGIKNIPLGKVISRRLLDSLQAYGCSPIHGDLHWVETYEAALAICTAIDITGSKVCIHLASRLLPILRQADVSLLRTLEHSTSPYRGRIGLMYHCVGWRWNRHHGDPAAVQPHLLWRCDDQRWEAKLRLRFNIQSTAEGISLREMLVDRIAKSVDAVQAIQAPGTRDREKVARIATAEPFLVDQEAQGVALLHSGDDAGDGRLLVRGARDAREILRELRHSPFGHVLHRHTAGEEQAALLVRGEKLLVVHVVSTVYESRKSPRAKHTFIVICKVLTRPGQRSRVASGPAASAPHLEMRLRDLPLDVHVEGVVRIAPGMTDTVARTMRFGDMPVSERNGISVPVPHDGRVALVHALEIIRVRVRPDDVDEDKRVGLTFEHVTNSGSKQGFAIGDLPLVRRMKELASGQHGRQPSFRIPGRGDGSPTWWHPAQTVKCPTGIEARACLRSAQASKCRGLNGRLTVSTRLPEYPLVGRNSAWRCLQHEWARLVSAWNVRGRSRRSARLRGCAFTGLAGAFWKVLMGLIGGAMVAFRPLSRSVGVEETLGGGDSAPPPPPGVWGALALRLGVDGHRKVVVGLDGDWGSCCLRLQDVQTEPAVHQEKLEDETGTTWSHLGGVVLDSRRKREKAHAWAQPLAEHGRLVDAALRLRTDADAKENAGVRVDEREERGGPTSGDGGFRGRGMNLRLAVDSEVMVVERGRRRASLKNARRRRLHELSRTPLQMLQHAAATATKLGKLSGREDEITLGKEARGGSMASKEARADDAEVDKQIAGKASVGTKVRYEAVREFSRHLVEKGVMGAENKRANARGKRGIDLVLNEPGVASLESAIVGNVPESCPAHVLAAIVTTHGARYYARRRGSGYEKLQVASVQHVENVLFVLVEGRMGVLGLNR